MKRKRFSTEQIAAVLQQAEQGIPIGELCRQVGISEQSFYRWKKVYGGLQPSEARELKQLRDEVTASAADCVNGWAGYQPRFSRWFALNVSGFLANAISGTRNNSGRLHGMARG